MKRAQSRLWRATILLIQPWLAIQGFAQTVPNAGQTLQTMPAPPLAPSTRTPATAIPDTEANRVESGTPTSQRIFVKRLRVTGAKLLATDVLEALVQDGAGKSLSLADLEERAARITRYYRDRGYLLSRAYVPQQDILDGDVQIAVLEARYGRIQLSNDSRLDDAKAQAFLAPIQAQAPIAADALQRQLLLLDELHGVAVTSTFKPGSSTGTSDLDIRLSPRPLLSGSLSLNNYGARSTGVWRAGANFNVANALHQGELFTFNFTGLRPDLRYGQAVVQWPLGGNGWGVGASYSRLDYQLGDSFESLGASGIARVGEWWMDKALVRSLDERANFQLIYADKKLHDVIDASDSDVHKQIHAWSARLSGNRFDRWQGGGATAYSLNLSVGQLGLDAGQATVDQSDAGHRTEGGFTKLNGVLSRQQSLGDSLSGYVSSMVQRSSANLDSAEKLPLGGPTAVRAYPVGEASCDDAWLVSLELRYQLPTVPGWQMFAFADLARGKVNHAPNAGDTGNDRHLSGLGVGTRWAYDSSVSLEAFAAWRTSSEPLSDTDRKPRLWLQAATFF